MQRASSALCRRTDGRAREQRERNHGWMWKRRTGGQRHCVGYIRLVHKPQSMRQDTGGRLQVGRRPHMRL